MSLQLSRPLSLAASVAASLAAALGCGDEEPIQPTQPVCVKSESGRLCVGPHTPSDDDDAGHDDGSSGGAGGAGGSGELPALCRTLTGTIRDFERGDEGGHPDFETFVGSGQPGLVKPKLGATGKPQLVSGSHPTITSARSFSEWYQDVPEVNVGFDVRLEFDSDEDISEFGSTEFFPLDDLGFGNQGQKHNYSFTTELHGRFAYKRGDEAYFTFQGDDDLWVFVNGKLAIDLGGVHSPRSATVDFDARAEELGLEDGRSYTFDLFHAERHSTGSTFRVTTNMKFVDCD